MNAIRFPMLECKQSALSVSIVFADIPKQLFTVSNSHSPRCSCAREKSQIATILPATLA